MPRLSAAFALFLCACTPMRSDMTLDRYLADYGEPGYVEGGNARIDADRESLSPRLVDMDGKPVSGLYRVDHDMSFGTLYEFKEGKLESMFPTMLPTIAMDSVMGEVAKYRKSDLDHPERMLMNVIMGWPVSDRDGLPLDGALYEDDYKCAYTFIGPVEDGRKHGDSYEFCDGKIAAVRPFSRGVVDGVLLTYWRDGTRKSRERYKNGEKKMLSEWYNSKGKLIRHKWF